jgi:hypothetical protein
MDAMYCEEYYLSDMYYATDYHTSQSWHYELAPAPAIAQIALGDFDETGRTDYGRVNIGFEECVYLDGSVTRTDNLPGTAGASAVRMISRNGLASVTFGIRSVNCSVSILLNIFQWPAVW